MDRRLPGTKVVVEWVGLLGAAFLGASALRFWARYRKTPTRNDDIRIDALVAALVGGVGWVYLAGIHHRLNPLWIPHGQDGRDYLACLGAMRFWNLETWVPFRYPLYPGVSALYAWLSDTPVYRAAMMTSVVTSALVPVGAYVLGRSLAARPVALVAALITLQLQVDPEVLGTPSPYPLAAATYALSFGALVFAIRDGGLGRHLFAGFALAAYMAVTAKAFPVILLGVGCVVLVQLAERKRDLGALTAFMFPMVACWLSFAWLDLPLHSLEAMMFDVQTQGGLIDRSRPYPDLGWSLDALITEQGYWEVGKLSALLHLPQVLTYVAMPPLVPMSFEDRYARFVPLVAQNLGLGSYGWLLVPMFLGGLGAWARGAARTRNVVATGFAVGVAVIHLWGLSSIQYAERFAMPVLATAPVLLLALFALPGRGLLTGARRELLVWLPLLAAGAWLIGPSHGQLGHAFIETRITGWQLKPSDPLLATRPVLAALRPGDVVLDLSFTHLARVLLEGPAIVVQRGQLATWSRADGEYFQLTAAASPGPRRWILLECVGTPAPGIQDPLRDVTAHFARHPERYSPVARCMYLDNAPLEPIDSDPGRLDPADAAPAEAGPAAP